MNILFSEITAPARQFLTDAEFKLTKEGGFVKAEMPDQWKIHGVTPTHSFLKDPDENLRAELIRDTPQSWHLLPRMPFRIIQFGCTIGKVLHLEKVIYSGPNPVSWLDTNHPGWHQNLPKHWIAAS